MNELVRCQFKKGKPNARLGYSCIEDDCQHWDGECIYPISMLNSDDTELLEVKENSDEN